jgi:hypothetical protein
MSGPGNTTLSRRSLLPIAAAAVVAPLPAVPVKASAVASASTQADRPGVELVANTSPAPADVAAGFLFDRGRYDLFDLPGTGEKSGLLGVNERGEMVGKYLDAAGVYHGLLRCR